MDTDYEAWNGERYVWPPPDDWYLAADGRWWAEGTGPGPAARSGRPPAPPTSGGPSDWKPTDTTPGGVGPASFDAEVRTTMSRPVGEDQTQVFNPGTGPSRQVAANSPVSTQNPLNTYDPTNTQNPLNTYDPTNTQNPLNTYDPTNTQNPLNTYDPTNTQNPLNTYDPTAVQGRPGSHTSSAAYGTGATTAVADRTLVAPPGYAPEAEHNGGGILEAPLAAADTGGDKASIIKRNPALVAAGGLIVVAMAIAGYLMTQSGGDGSTLQSPSDLAESSSETSLPAAGDAMTDDTDDAMTDDPMADDTGDAMTDDPMTDDTGDATTDDTGDAMTDGTDDGTTDGEQTAVSEQDAMLIDQFRTKLDELEITAAALSSGELLAFGQTACGYAQNSASLDEYTTTRTEALAAAQNDELGAEELSLVVDTAVTVFCAEDAGRIGLELPTVPASS